MDIWLKNLLERENIEVLNPERFRYENHQTDNRVILYISDILDGNKYEDVAEVIGYTEHPSYREDKGAAVMFETETGEEFWCHV